MTDPYHLHFHVTPTIDAEGDGHRITLLCQTTDQVGKTVRFERRDMGVWPLGQDPAAVLAAECARQEVECWKFSIAAALKETLTWTKETA